MISAGREIWAIIPARGGSKGLPRKNIVPLNGIPLIAYSIKVAASAARISRVIVSTDDKEIAAIAEKYGAEVPFLRPPDLSGDRSEIGDAIDYTVDRIVREEGRGPFGLCILYPTHPFRYPDLLNTVAGGLEDYIQVNTVFKTDADMNRFVAMGNDGPLSPVVDKAEQMELYHSLGTAYGFRYFPPEVRVRNNPKAYAEHIDQLLKNGGLKSRFTKLVPVDDPLFTVDIDGRHDLELAEAIIRTGYDFGGVTIGEYCDSASHCR